MCNFNNIILEKGQNAGGVKSNFIVVVPVQGIFLVAVKDTKTNILLGRGDRYVY